MPVQRSIKPRSKLVLMDALNGNRVPSRCFHYLTQLIGLLETIPLPYSQCDIAVSPTAQLLV